MLYLDSLCHLVRQLYGGLDLTVCLLLFIISESLAPISLPVQRGLPVNREGPLNLSAILEQADPKPSKRPWVGIH